jgi:hypothetical protein
MKKEDVIETFNLLQQDKNVKKVFDADISARIPYRLHCCVYNFNREVWVEDDILYNYDLGGNCQTLKILNERGACLMYYQIRPYLRPMSSMTEEEKRHISKMMCLRTYDDGVVHDMTYPVYTPYYVMEDCLNYLRSIHVDYSGLIEKNLALEAPEGMYDLKKK